MYMAGIFWKENGLILLFLAARTTDTKFRRSTGVTTANSTNKYQKYKSVELGDQLRLEARVSQPSFSFHTNNPIFNQFVTWHLQLKEEKIISRKVKVQPKNNNLTSWNRIIWKCIVEDLSSSHSFTWHHHILSFREACYFPTDTILTEILATNKDKMGTDDPGRAEIVWYHLQKTPSNLPKKYFGDQQEEYGLCW